MPSDARHCPSLFKACFLFFFYLLLQNMSFTAKVLTKAPKLQYSSFMNSITCHLRHGNDLHHVPSRTSVHQAGCKVVSDAPLSLSPILSAFQRERRETGALETTIPQGHREVISLTEITLSLSGKAGTHKHSRMETTAAHTRGCRGRSNLL